MSRHGENAQRRSARQLAEAGKREAAEKFAALKIEIECPLPCMCAAGVAQYKAMHSNPDYDGRHWHERQWEGFDRQNRLADIKRAKAMEELKQRVRMQTSAQEGL